MLKSPPASRRAKWSAWARRRLPKRPRPRPSRARPASRKVQAARWMAAFGGPRLEGCHDDANRSDGKCQMRKLIEITDLTQGVWHRQCGRPGVAGRERDGRTGRVCRHHGSFRFGQVHADEYPGLPGSPDERHLHTRWRRREPVEQESVGECAQQKDRLCLSIVQPAAPTLRRSRM